MPPTLRRFPQIVAAAALAAALAVTSSAVAGGTTWFVDASNPFCPGSGTPADPFCTIQDGIDAASDGDEVVVAPGFYLETINFNGKAITVRSSLGPALTTITPIFPDSVVYCITGEGPDTILDGFTITGGSGSPLFGFLPGGGMINIGSSPTVRNCSFFLEQCV